MFSRLRFAGKDRIAMRCDHVINAATGERKTLTARVVFLCASTNATLRLGTGARSRQRIANEFARLTSRARRRCRGSDG